MKKILTTIGGILLALIITTPILVLSGNKILPLFISSEGRVMNEAEIALVSKIFGDEIDYSRILLIEENYVPLQDGSMSPDGNIYFENGGGRYEDDFSTAEIHNQAAFIHELTHVWQYQNGVDVYGTGVRLHIPYFLGNESKNPYTLPVQLDPTIPFSDYNIEQQGNIVRNFFYITQGFRENNDETPADIYNGIIPFITQ